MAAMSFTLRTPAHGSLTVGYRLAAPRRHPTFATDKPAHPALSALTSSSSSLQGIVQASLPSALASFVSSHCALHLNLAEKVLAPAACGSTRTAIAEAHTAVSVAIGYRLAAPHRHPIDFSLRLPNAQSSLFRASGTLSAVNRLVLHSHSLQTQCFAAGASRVVGGVSLPEVLHYARRTPSASPPFEHSPTSPQSRHKCRLCRE